VVHGSTAAARSTPGGRTGLALAFVENRSGAVGHVAPVLQSHRRGSR
jgi:hypothetical protein